MKTYDMLFIFPSLLTDEGLDKALESIQQEITRLGGSVERVDRMGRRSFARQIQKKDDGLYVRIWILLDPAQSAALLARLKFNEDIMRVQVRRLEGGVPPVTAPQTTPLVAAEVMSDGQS